MPSDWTQRSNASAGTTYFLILHTNNVWTEVEEKYKENKGKLEQTFFDLKKDFHKGL